MGPEDQHPWDREDEEIAQAFAAKDAEFQNAKEWNQLCEMQIRNLQDIVASQDQLITELTDALYKTTKGIELQHLRYPHRVWQELIDENKPLIQIAREATK